MANDDQLKLIYQGKEIWNKWREEYPDVLIHLEDCDLKKICLPGVNLERANLTGAYLKFADLTGSNLSNAILTGAKLAKATLNYCNLTGADFRRAELQGAELKSAVLRKANFADANLYYGKFNDADCREASFFKAICVRTDFSGASLSAANLKRAIFLETKIEQAILDEAKIYGISSWGLRGVPMSQKGLIITPPYEAEITVDDLQVAQLIYFLYNNPNVRNVISTIGRKAVLILGRFTPERKLVLNAIKQKLRDHGFLPILFDFPKAIERDFTETVKILAGLSRFVVADLSSPKSIAQELEATVRDFMIPFVPIIQTPEKPYSMFLDFQNRYPERVLKLVEFSDLSVLLDKFQVAIIDRALQAEENLMYHKAQDIIRTIR